MKKAFGLGSFGCWLLLGFSGLAHADEDIPAYRVLTCEVKCPQRVEAKLLDPSRPAYPASEIPNAAEALVDVSYTIGTDGGTKGAMIEQLIGAQPFADAVLAAVAGRRYQPATEDGKPVEQNARIRFLFSVGGLSRFARGNTSSNYRAAIALEQGGDAAGAVAALNAIEAKPDLNLYERTMVAFALAGAEVKAGDDAAALDAVRIATISGGSFLDYRTRERALRLRIELEAQAGQPAEAFAWFQILEKTVTVAADDHEAQLVAQLHAAIDTPAPLAMVAAIPQLPHEAFWQHTLLRRTFAFSQIQGKLDDFDLRCDQHGIESPVSDKAEWNVPKSWTGCVLYVHGAAGTKFEFVELQPAAK